MVHRDLQMVNSKQASSYLDLIDFNHGYYLCELVREYVLVVCVCVCVRQEENLDEKMERQVLVRWSIWRHFNGPIRGYTISNFRIFSVLLK